jgi:outer membrane protein TolC
MSQRIKQTIMHRYFLIFMCLFFIAKGNNAQSLDSLTLVQAYEMAEQNYPLLKNKILLQEATNLKLESLGQSRLPTIEWKADATIQSETVDFPDDFVIPLKLNLPLFNAKTYAEAQYLIIDGGINSAQQELERLQLETNQQSIEVDLNSLKGQINQSFIGVLLFKEQILLLDVTLKDLGIRKETLEAGVRHGVVLESEVDKISVKELELIAEIEKIESDVKALITVLERFVGKGLSDDLVLVLPQIDNFQLGLQLDRPEQELFRLQKQALLANENLIEGVKKPKLSAFARAGVGYANPLNLFDTSLSPYAMGGLAFSWNLFDWGKSDRDRQLLTIQSQVIDNQRETFEHNLNLTEGKFAEDISKLEKQLLRGEQITALQNKILKQLAVQLENGVITVNDYLIQVNAELRARQQLQLHEIQLVQIKIDYLTQRGTF